MNGRDVRTVVLGATSSAAVLVLAYWGIGRLLPAFGLMAGYDLWLLTRPRARRLLRRASGKTPPRDTYFREESDSYIAERAAIDNGRPRTLPPIRPPAENRPAAAEGDTPAEDRTPGQAAPEKIATSHF